jgi:hypothetical protein
VNPGSISASSTSLRRYVSSARASELCREGFVLLAVLWMLAAVSTLVLSLEVLAHDALDSTRNRESIMKATWIAEGCAAEARSLITDSLRYARHGDDVWQRIDGVLSQGSFLSGCDVEAIPTGMKLDVNTVGIHQLAATLRAAGWTAERADSISTLLIENRDSASADLGSGQSTYRPRGPFASVVELRRFAESVVSSGLDSLLGAEPDRVFLARAPLPIIAGLPGMNSEAVALIADRRASGIPIRDLDSLAAQLAIRSREALLEHYGELVRLTTSVPEAWVLTCRARIGQPAVTVMLELRLVRAGARVAVVRRRSSP